MSHIIGKVAMAPVQDLTTTITFSVTTTVVAFVLLYLVLRVGKQQNEIRRLALAVKMLASTPLQPAHPATPPEHARRFNLSGPVPAAASGGEPGSGGLVQIAPPPLSITTTSPGGLTAPGNAAVAAATLALEAAVSPVFVPPPAPSTWDSPGSPLNSSNPSVAVVVLTPNTVLT